MRRHRVGVGSLALVMSTALTAGCTTGPTTGQIDVRVTLSRNIGGGGVGPSFDHIPQADWDVSVTESGGTELTGTTDGDGRAHFSVPPGEYDVSAEYCTGPQHVDIAAGSTARLEFDCAAP